MKKKKSIIIKLQSEASSHFYTTTRSNKSRMQQTDKIKLKKYDPITQKHEIYKEKKIK